MTDQVKGQPLVVVWWIETTWTAAALASTSALGEKIMYDEFAQAVN